MWELGNDNWIKYGWTNKLNNEWVPGDQLFVDFLNNGIPIEDIDAVRAAHLAIDAITRTFPSPYTLMCSGGVDSQAMLYAWHTSGHKFQVTSVRYKSVGQFFNEHDLVCLSQMSEKFNIQVNYVDFDIINFLENDLSLTAKTNDCDSPQICTHIKFLEAVPSGTAIFAGNFLTSSGQSAMNYTLLGVHRHALINKRINIIPNFFTFTPELAYSFIRKMNESTNKKINNTIDTSIKNTTYIDSGFDILIPVLKYFDDKPVTKFTGFETLKEYYEGFGDKVDKFTRFKFSSKESDRVFDILFRYPYEGSGLCKQSYRPMGLIKRKNNV